MAAQALAAPEGPLLRLRMRVSPIVAPYEKGDFQSVKVVGPLGMVWRLSLYKSYAVGAQCALDAHAPAGHPYAFTATARDVRVSVWRFMEGKWVRNGAPMHLQAVVTFAPPRGWRWECPGVEVPLSAACPLAIVAEWRVTDVRAVPPPTPWVPGPAPCAGIQNQGATCYLNSLLQVPRAVLYFVFGAVRRAHWQRVTCAQTLFHTRLIRRVLLDSVPPAPEFPGAVLYAVQVGLTARAVTRGRARAV